MNDHVRRIIDAHPPHATLEHAEHGHVLTMVRDLDLTPDEAFAWISEPERLARWSPIVPDRVLDEVGPAQSRETPDVEPVCCDVLAVDPPHSLSHRWGGDVVTWAITDLGEGHVQLAFRERVPGQEAAAMNAAGWHLCLAVLEALVAGHDVPRVVGTDAVEYGWEGLRDRYATILAELERECFEAHGPGDD